MVRALIRRRIRKSIPTNPVFDPAGFQPSSMWSVLLNQTTRPGSKESVPWSGRSRAIGQHGPAHHDKRPEGITPIRQPRPRWVSLERAAGKIGDAPGFFAAWRV